MIEILLRQKEKRDKHAKQTNQLLENMLNIMSKIVKKSE
jgi:hypothetical protein